MDFAYDDIFITRSPRQKRNLFPSYDVLVHNIAVVPFRNYRKLGVWHTLHQLLYFLQ